MLNFLSVISVVGLFVAGVNVMCAFAPDAVFQYLQIAAM